MHFSFASRTISASLAIAVSIFAARAAHAEPATAPPVVRVERNSLAMTITGISLSTIGFAGVGVGTGLVLYGNRQCGVAAGAAPAMLYSEISDHCRSNSDLITGGIVAIVAVES